MHRRRRLLLVVVKGGRRGVHGGGVRRAVRIGRVQRRGNTAEIVTAAAGVLRLVVQLHGTMEGGGGGGGWLLLLRCLLLEQRVGGVVLHGGRGEGGATVEKAQWDSKSVSVCSFCSSPSVPSCHVLQRVCPLPPRCSALCFVLAD